MALGPNNRFGARAGRMTHSQAYDASIDMGLRKYMLGVYNYMTLGVAITGLMAYVVSTQPAVMQQRCWHAATDSWKTLPRSPPVSNWLTKGSDHVSSGWHSCACTAVTKSHGIA